MSKASEARAADVFFALGDGTRLSVVRKLGSGGALTATALSEGAVVTRQAIVKHLRVLEGAGLVTHRKRGREVLYALQPRRLEDARAFLDGISAGWDRAIERLRRLVEEPPPRGKALAPR
jgi:DNA-binding transcriptional ArsR family regulator